MDNWSIQLTIICSTIVVLFGIAAYLAYSSIGYWYWFLLAALAISAGFDFKESDCDVVDYDGDNCKVHNNGDNIDG